LGKGCAVSRGAKLEFVELGHQAIEIKHLQLDRGAANNLFDVQAYLINARKEFPNR